MRASEFAGPVFPSRVQTESKRPNVHLICEADAADEVERRVSALPAVRRVLTSGPGAGPELLDGHLF